MEPAKMQHVADLLRAALEGLPFAKIVANDNLMSSVYLHGSLEAPEQWTNRIYENSYYFIVSIVPPKGARWFDGNDLMTAKVVSAGFRGVKDFRKYTATAAKVVAKIAEWVETLSQAKRAGAIVRA
jgi:hypothetical protein